MIVAIWFTLRAPWLKLTSVKREKNEMHCLHFLRSLIPCLCFALMLKKVRENPWEENAKSITTNTASVTFCSSAHTCPCLCFWDFQKSQKKKNIWTIGLLPEFSSDTQTCLYEITFCLHKMYAIQIVIISFKDSHKIVDVLLNNTVLTNDNIIFNGNAIF